MTVDSDRYSQLSLRLRKEMVARLIQCGYLKTARWQNAFTSVERERFVEHFDIPSPLGGFERFDPSGDYESYLNSVYTDKTLITLFSSQGVATSSSTTPSLMATMLELLDAQPGEHVLEVGFGTGYNTALLCSVVGNETMTAIDVEPDLTSRGEQVMPKLGYWPSLHSGDGRLGVPERAPYDCIIATCGASRIPSAWMEQIRPAGRIVVNVAFGLVRLDVDQDGSASGRFLQSASFMAMHNHENDHVPPRELIEMGKKRDLQEETFSSVDPSFLRNGTVQFLRKLYYPELRQVIMSTDEGEQCFLYDPSTDSWARATIKESETSISWSGSRNLWKGIDQIILEWQKSGEPDMERYGLTVQRNGQHVLWLDSPAPENAVSVLDS